MAKNKESKHHRLFNNLNKRDKAFVISHFQSVIHLESMQGKSLKQMWIKGCQEVLRTTIDTVLPSGKELCRHGYDKYYDGNPENRSSAWAEYEKAGTISCTLPTYDWAKDRRNQHSLINLKEYLYGWRDRPFTMAFISPANRPKTSYYSREAEADEKLDCISDIKGALTLVRQVWKQLLVSGRNMTIRQAHWVSILSKGFDDIKSKQGLEEVISSALHYAQEESAFQLLNKTKEATDFDTSILDTEHMLFGNALTIDKVDDNAVEIEHDILSKLYEVAPRYMSTFTAPYSDQLDYEFKRDTLPYTMKDNAFVIGLTLLLQHSELDDVSMKIKAILNSDSSSIFTMAVRYAVKQAGYHEWFNMPMWERDYKEVLNILDSLVALLIGIPSNVRNARVLDILGIEHRKYTPVDDTLLEAEIMLLGATTKDQIHQLKESLTLVEAITQQGS